MSHEPYMLTTCQGCNKQVPALCCSAYLDPSVLIWIRLGCECPMNQKAFGSSEKQKINPLKASKREARMRKAK